MCIRDRYGTTVIREAANRRSILDQIYIQTGMRVDVIDMPKEVYYKYALLYYKITNQYRLTDPTLSLIHI